VLEGLPVDSDATLDTAIALGAARFNAQVTLEQIGNVSDTLTTVLRFLAQQKPKDMDECLAFAGAGETPG
jgi:hypothetical protein